MIEGWAFNPPPHWPKPPASWTPPAGWVPDPAWGPLPPGWQLWVPARPAQRRRGLLPTLGLATVVAGAVLAVLVPRSAGPGPGDPRTGGSALALRAALIEPAAGPATTTSPTTGPTAAGPTASTGATAGATAGASAGVTEPTVPIPTSPLIRRFRTCAELNRVYPNGVGMPRAIDRTRGTPVTNFGRSAGLYHANRGLDRDRDGIACEPS